MGVYFKRPDTATSPAILLIDSDKFQNYFSVVFIG
jgi:hypothetical protein